VIRAKEKPARRTTKKPERAESGNVIDLMAVLQHGPFTVIEHDARDRTRVRFHHGFANDREGLLAHLVVRHQGMRRVVPDPAYRIGWHETVYVDRAGAFERDSKERSEPSNRAPMPTSQYSNCGTEASLCETATAIPPTPSAGWLLS
jgi:hypothetical protein